ncbi:hypothetical protein LWI29_015902 [Acer saccharum]|uniref:Uncharacterized protein n=1 Tax=Acer saccharum TaxID=4024 RepID=A0AA39TAK8_ACESA|nr:hypothetical protein LWI29_015902 [Acer saccharum]
MFEACQAGEAQAERIRQLEAQLKESEDRRSRAEFAHQEGVRSSQNALLRAEQNAEDAKSTYECRIEDLERQALTRGMVSAGEFFKQKNRTTDRAKANWSLSIRKHVDTSLESLRIQMKEWRAYCKSKGKAPHPMHLEVPTTESFSTFYACEKAGINNERPNLGPVPGTDYSY